MPWLHTGAAVESEHRKATHLQLATYAKDNINELAVPLHLYVVIYIARMFIALLLLTFQLQMQIGLGNKMGCASRFSILLIVPSLILTVVRQFKFYDIHYTIRNKYKFWVICRETYSRDYLLQHQFTGNAASSFCQLQPAGEWQLFRIPNSIVISVGK
jgi:hypothetical protein